MQGIPGKKTVFAGAFQRDFGYRIIQAQDLQMSFRYEHVEIAMKFTHRHKAILLGIEHRFFH